MVDISNRHIIHVFDSKKNEHQLSFPSRDQNKLHQLLQQLLDNIIYGDVLCFVELLHPCKPQVFHGKRILAVRPGRICHHEAPSGLATRQWSGIPFVSRRRAQWPWRRYLMQGEYLTRFQLPGGFYVSFLCPSLLVRYVGNQNQRTTLGRRWGKGEEGEESDYVV